MTLLQDQSLGERLDGMVEKLMSVLLSGEPKTHEQMKRVLKTQLLPLIRDARADGILLERERVIGILQKKRPFLSVNLPQTLLNEVQSGS